MPAFTAIVNNIYLFLIPVGILVGRNAKDPKMFALHFVFYLLFVPAIAGILNKIMYVSESFMEINNNVARMDEILYISELADNGTKVPAGCDVRFENVSFSYEGRTAFRRRKDSLRQSSEPPEAVRVLSPISYPDSGISEREA